MPGSEVPELGAGVPEPGSEVPAPGSEVPELGAGVPEPGSEVPVPPKPQSGDSSMFSALRSVKVVTVLCFQHSEACLLYTSPSPRD